MSSLTPEEQQLLQSIHTNVRKLKQYFQWMLTLSLITLVIPILILAIAIPFLINTLGSLNPLSNLGL